MSAPPQRVGAPHQRGPCPERVAPERGPVGRGGQPHPGYVLAITERIATLADEIPTQDDALGIIEVEKGERRSPDGRARRDLRPFPSKVLGPCVDAWMKQGRDCAALGINRGEIRPFIAVAAKTGVGEIIKCCLAAVLCGDDVIGFVREPQDVIRHAAVFAAATRTVNHGLPQRSPHALAHDPVPASGVPGPARCAPDSLVGRFD